MSASVSSTLNPQTLYLTLADGRQTIALNPVRLASQPLILGSHFGHSEIVLPFEGVSRRHASFGYREDDGHIIVQDEASFNGILVNGEYICAPTPLFPDDILNLGAAELHFGASQSPVQTLPGVGRLVVEESGVKSVRAGAFCRLTPQHAFSIGRSANCDLVLRTEDEAGLRVSRKQAEIRWDTAQQAYVLHNSGATNPTLLNGTPLRGSHTLQEGDRLEINGTRLRYYAPDSLPITNDNGKIPSSAFAQPGVSEWVLRYTGKTGLHEGARALRLPAERLLNIGRGKESDLQLRDPSVSRRHARLEPYGANFRLVDLGATNPILVNGARLLESVELAASDILQLGEFEFRLDKFSPDESGLPVLSSQVTLSLALEELPVGANTLIEPTFVNQLRPPTVDSLPIVRRGEILPEPEAALPLDLSFEEACRRMGTLVTLSGNQAFLLDEPGHAWIVQRGQVEIFAVQIKDERVSSSRYHVCTVQPGQAFFSTDARRYGENLNLLAVPLENTELVTLPTFQLRRFATNSVWDKSVSELVAGWLEKLFGDILSASEPVKLDVTLELGKKTDLEAGQRAATPRNGSWLRLPRVTGRLLFQGEEEIRADGADLLFPMGELAWVQAVETCRVEILPSEKVLSEPGAWNGLEAFYEIYFRFKFTGVRRLFYEELNRLNRQESYDTNVRRDALTYLAAVAENREAHAPALATTAPDLLLAVCRLVGAAQGIEIKEPPVRENPGKTDRLAEIVRASQIRARRVALEPNWYNTDNGALVGYTADNKPVALLPISSRAYRMVDGTGKATLVTKEIAETLQPEGYVFYRALPNQKLKLSSLLRFGLRNAGQELATIGFFGLLVSLLGLATPILTALIFDNIIPARQAGLLWQIYLALVVVAISGAIFTLLRSIATLRLETRLENALQAALWDRLLKLPINFFRNYAVGDLAERVGGIETIRQLLTGTVITSLLSGLFSLTSLFLLFSYDGTLALVALLLTVINLLVILVFGWQQLRRERELATQHGYMSSLALQLLNGIAKLRVAGGESRAFARWAAGFGKQRQITLATRQAANRLQVFNGVWTILVTLALFATIGFMSSGKNLSTGSFLAFLVAFGQFQAALLGLSEVFTEILKILPLYDRSRPILESLPEVANDKRDPGELKGDIEVNQVSFRYSPNLPPVLKDISLRIKPGQFVAVVGASGSGKSSLLRLLLGFEQPESGSIYYDKQDLATLDVQAVRQQIGAVIQNGKLLPGTIFENIAGAAPYTMQEAWEAARLAGFAQDIESMPMGMHTVISESGSTLSGGQRQRLMIARALIGQPRLILFDEATSALDNQTQAIVSQSLEKMQVTRVVIAHRLSTIQKADCIYLLKDGRIAESGTYAELMENGKFFYELASRQIV